MKISGLHIDGYGVWSGLKLEGLGDGLNVLYGPNEAGKTTLLQFVRSVLYGFSPGRQKYFPPVRGGRPGGSLEVAGPAGQFRLDRYHDMGPTGDQEQLTLTAADGTRQGEHFIRVLLSEVDETIYNNVFAVGLREIQELGTLSDTEAAELLYSLTAGLDRVSLVDVMRGLETSRNGILDVDGGPCQVVQLFEQREKLREEIAELGKLTRRYGRLAAQQNQLQREVVRLEEENHQTEHQTRVIELAVTLRERWMQREELDDQLAALGPSATLPEGAVQRLDELNARLQKYQQQVEQLRQRRQQLGEEAARSKINEPLWRQAARIEALLEQEPWIASLDGQVRELQAEVDRLQSDLDAQCKQLGLGDQTEADALPAVSARSLATLRPPAKAMKLCRGQLEEANRQQATARETAESLDRQIEAALTARGESDLADAMDRSGGRAAQLRRRVQIDERLDQMTLYQQELEEQSRGLVDRQLLPVWVLIGLGAVFVFGVVLFLAGLFMPASVTGSVGLTMIVLGLTSGIAAGAGKVLLERSNARQLDACQKQHSMLQMQIKQAKEERDALDGQLPTGGGPIVSRLEVAERELASLEELLPLDTRRQAARQEAQTAADCAAEAKEDLALARRRWRETLAGVGLPENLAPKQVRLLIEQCDQISQVQSRLQLRREELQRRRGELDSLLGRIEQTVADTGADVTADGPVQRLRQLAAAAAEQQSRVEHRQALRRQARQIRRKRTKYEDAIGRLKLRRRELLREADADNEQDFRQRALQAARAEVLRQQRDAVAQEIAAAVGNDCPEEAIREQLASGDVEQLLKRSDELLERLTLYEGQLRERFERRGQLAEQLKTLADDRRLTDKQLELAAVEQRLRQAAARWQVLAVTGRTLETIRTIYEQQRQPEVLQEASGYLDRLTRGRYCRVWTPLGEDVLRIDDGEGNSLAVETLSRGTREQLFLALRLALAASYARRGATLPLVLDDVLVNFDADRAAAAATVLRDFADAGHQVLVFTCHEHIFKLFESLNVPANRLPDNAEPSPAAITFQKPKKQRARRKSKKAEPKPVKLTPEEQPDTDEIMAIDDGPIEEVAVEEDPVEEIVIEEPIVAKSSDPSDEEIPWAEEDIEDEVEDEEDLDDEEDDDELEEDEEEEYDEDDADEYEDEEEDEYEEDEAEEYEDDDTAEAA